MNSFRKGPDDVTSSAHLDGTRRTKQTPPSDPSLMALHRNRPESARCTSKNPTTHNNNKQRQKKKRKKKKKAAYTKAPKVFCCSFGGKWKPLGLTLQGCWNRGSQLLCRLPGCPVCACSRWGLGGVWSEAPVTNPRLAAS